jgi:hypothetical protein
MLLWTPPIVFSGGVLLAVGMLMIPTVVAMARRHRHRTTILVVNLLLGWTGFVWIFLLAWAFAGERQKE